MPETVMQRRSQREIREGKAPRRLADRSAIEHMKQARWQSGAAFVTRQVALAVAVLCLVIASTIVHSNDLSGMPALQLSAQAADSWHQHTPSKAGIN
jgi:hypothetical protein